MTSEIFCRRRRRQIRARAKSAPIESRWLFKRNADDILERLSFVMRPFDDALVFGDIGGYEHAALTSLGTKCYTYDLEAAPDVDFAGDEDVLTVGSNRFDLIIVCGMLDTVNDLPGALVQMRRALRPGGLFLAAMSGAGSLTLLRSTLSQAVSEGVLEARPRLHPQIDLRSAGDLMRRAGFHLPVVDCDTVDAQYKRLEDLVRDLRNHGLSSALPNALPLSRSDWAKLQLIADRFRSQARLNETFSTIFLTGWAPQEGDPLQAGPITGLFQDMR